MVSINTISAIQRKHIYAMAYLTWDCYLNQLIRNINEGNFKLLHSYHFRIGNLFGELMFKSNENEIIVDTGRDVFAMLYMQPYLLFFKFYLKYLDTLVAFDRFWFLQGYLIYSNQSIVFNYLSIVTTRISNKRWESIATNFTMQARSTLIFWQYNLLVNSILNKNLFFIALVNFYWIQRSWIKLIVRNFNLLNLIFLVSNNAQMGIFKTITDIYVHDMIRRLNRFYIKYLITNIVKNYKFLIEVKARALTIMPSITILYMSAGWLEREIWDMFGIFFINHIDFFAYPAAEGDPANPVPSFINIASG